jgi:desulfoferrodoxin (superoxide reductase-like protein)
MFVKSEVRSAKSQVTKVKRYDISVSNYTDVEFKKIGQKHNKLEVWKYCNLEVQRRVILIKLFY